MVESTLFGTGKSGCFCGAGLLLFLSLELVRMSYSIQKSLVFGQAAEAAGLFREPAQEWSFEGDLVGSKKSHGSGLALERCGD